MGESEDESDAEDREQRDGQEEWSDEDGEYGGDVHEPVRKREKGEGGGGRGQDGWGLDGREKAGSRSDSSNNDSSDEDGEKGDGRGGPGLSFVFSSDEEEGGDGDKKEVEASKAAHKAAAPFFGPPPKAFRVELSPFNFVWSLLSAWITQDTISYLSCLQPKTATQHSQSTPEHRAASRAESEEAAVSSPSLHSHNMQARAVLSGLLEPHVHRLLRALHAHAYASEVDKRLSYALNTLVFPGPVPSLSKLQWNLMSLALLRALSLGCIPGLAEAFEGSGTDLLGLLRNGVLEEEGNAIQPAFSLPHLSSLVDLLLHD